MSRRDHRANFSERESPIPNHSLRTRSSSAVKTSTEGASGRYSGIWYSFATRATSPELAATVWSDGWRRPCGARHPVDKGDQKARRQAKAARQPDVFRTGAWHDPREDGGKEIGLRQRDLLRILFGLDVDVPDLHGIGAAAQPSRRQSRNCLTLFSKLLS